MHPHESLEEFVENVKSTNEQGKGQNQVVAKRIEYYRDEYCDEPQLFYSMR